MSLLAQELQCVSLLLQGVLGRVGCAVYFQVSGLDFHCLTLALRGHQFALHMNGGAGSDRFESLFRELFQVEHYLDVLYGGAVVECHELHMLVAATGADPSLHIDCAACGSGLSAEQLLHCLASYSLVHFCRYYSNVP